MPDGGYSQYFYHLPSRSHQYPSWRVNLGSSHELMAPQQVLRHYTNKTDTLLGQPRNHADFPYLRSAVIANPERDSSPRLSTSALINLSILEASVSPRRLKRTIKVMRNKPSAMASTLCPSLSAFLQLSVLT